MIPGKGVQSPAPRHPRSGTSRARHHRLAHPSIRCGLSARCLPGSRQSTRWVGSIARRSLRVQLLVRLLGCRQEYQSPRQTRRRWYLSKPERTQRTTGACKTITPDPPLITERRNVVCRSASPRPRVPVPKNQVKRLRPILRTGGPNYAWPLIKSGSEKRKAWPLSLMSV
jgi:hypothetical protein